MRRLLLTLLLAGVLVPGVAGANGWGPRVGVTMGPDQVHFGAHADLGNLAQHITFQPSVELGVGDNLTILSLNFDGEYRFSSRWDVWNPYLGGGVGAHFVSDDNDGISDGNNTETGLAVLGGIQKGLASGSRFFLETKVGLFDSPDLKFTAGWTFH